MNPLYIMDLTEDWNFYPDAGDKMEHLNTLVGGWLKQGYACECALYEKHLKIPDIKPSAGNLSCPAVIMLEMGAVNHSAIYHIVNEAGTAVKVHEETTAFTPQSVDLTGYVHAGEWVTLQIFVRSHQESRPVAPHSANWCECIARGIFRFARISVYPGIYIQDVFVKTSVTRRCLEYRVAVFNGTCESQTLTLDVSFSSWNGSDFAYPLIQPVRINAVPGLSWNTLKPATWMAGKVSWWWPNVPYEEGYQAQLHLLKVRISYANRKSDIGMGVGQSNLDECLPNKRISLLENFQHEAVVRFGFREVCQNGKYYELNGVRFNFRGDSLQPANYDRIDFGGKGDAVGTLPGFLPPSATNPGWPKAVDNFLKLNFNVQRQHMAPWTPYMLDVCDEMGLPSIGESAARLNGFDRVDGRVPYEAKCLQDIVMRDRNHPSILRWSMVNEPQCDDPLYHLSLYNAVKAADDTRPVSEDIWSIDYMKQPPEEVFSLLLDKLDFSWFEHYLSVDEEGKVVRTCTQMNDGVIHMKGRPFGLGEADLDSVGTPASLVHFAATVALVRAEDASDVRPYVLLASWASSIPGVRTGDFVLEGERFHPLYGEDNLPDPWVNAGIKLLQKACHPLFAFDPHFWHVNRHSNAAGSFPVIVPELEADTEVNRDLFMFNDLPEGNKLTITCGLQAGSTSNPPFAKACIDLSLQPGFMKRVKMSFTTPPLNTALFLSIHVEKRGTIATEKGEPIVSMKHLDSYAFSDDSCCYKVIHGLVSDWNYIKGNDRSIGSLKLKEWEV